MNRKQCGKFNISWELFEEGNIDDLATVFKLLNFVPCEVVKNNTTYEMTGLSDQFEEIKEGNIIPTYNITMHAEEGVIVGLEAKREVLG